jgi:hypothetical protein
MYNRYRVFPGGGGKVRPGRAADHSPPSSAAVMEEYLYPPSRMDLQEVGCGYGDWVGLARDREGWRKLVNAVMNLRVP